MMLKNDLFTKLKLLLHLNHNNICTIYEIGETEDDQLFISMPLYEGETLRQKIEKGLIKIDDAVDITVQISRRFGQSS